MMDDGEDVKTERLVSMLHQVLDLISTQPEKIVDDTYIEKLLSWLATVALDEKQRTAFFKPDILKFLSSSLEVLLPSPVCANFFLRLLGILAGSSSKNFETFSENRILDNMFGNYISYENTHLKNALVRYAFFEGLSSLLNSHEGFTWISKNKGIISYATKSFADPSFYVIKSAVKFLKSLLMVPLGFDVKSKSASKDDVLQIISSEFAKADLKDQPIYLDLVAQLFNADDKLANALMDSFGGLTSFVPKYQIIQKNSKMLQSVTEICIRMLTDERLVNPDVTVNNIDENLIIVDIILKVSIQMAKADIAHTFHHLGQISYNQVSHNRVFQTHWNELLLWLLNYGILHKQLSEITKPSDWLKGHNDFFSKDTIQLVENLESEMEEQLINQGVWKECLLVSLDACKPILTRRMLEFCSRAGISMVESYAVFLSDLIMIAANDGKRHSSKFSTELISVCSSQRKLSCKCVSTIKEIVINGWLSAFSADAKSSLISSVIETMNNLSIDAQTLSACIQLFSCLIDNMDDETSCQVFRPVNQAQNLHQNAKMATVMDNLVRDSRWEVQDSMFDMISMICIKAKDNKYMREFLMKHQFWLATWESLDADESYLRASAVHLIGIILENADVRETLWSSFSLDDVLARLLNVLREDDEAFPKRSVLEAARRWLSLEEVQEAVRDELLRDENTGKENYFGNQVYKAIFNILNFAFQSFDWEVKLKGIKCWTKIFTVSIDTVSKSGNRGCASEELKPAKSQKLAVTNCEKVQGVKETVDLLCSRNGSSVLVASINDCDQLVREAALDTLHLIKNKCLPKDPEAHETSFDYTSCYDVEQINDANFSNVSEFLDFLRRTDFQLLKESIRLADDQVVNDPMSLLDDIISAAKHSDDNLLDCY